MVGRSRMTTAEIHPMQAIKVDILALGMLTCINKCLKILKKYYNKSFSVANIPAEDPAVYDMLCKADTVGVFQVESRAQMSMLPRLKPRNFYDLVIEVAIVRPGPIQGDMVHPYLRRRDGRESIDFPSTSLRQVLGKTLGIPLFQEQAMKVAIVAAGFTPEESDGLRRSLATFRHIGDIHQFKERFLQGMLENGYQQEFAERCFKQIEGFADYGFPESHAASFALLVYASSWLKCHYPAAFACALLNSQPMGFYAPAQIIRDLREHGVEVRPADINESDWDCTLEALSDGEMALRLGFSQIKDIKETDIRTLMLARKRGYRDIPDLWQRTGLSKSILERLARADAFISVGLDRRLALWVVKGLDNVPLPLFRSLERALPEPNVMLPKMPLGEEVADDYRTLAFSLKAHPLSLLRKELIERNYQANEYLAQLPYGRRVRIAGLVTGRQRPASAKGVMFMTLEDETGTANVIVWPKVFDNFRRPVLRATLVGIIGEVQKEGQIIHVVSYKIEDLTPLLATLEGSSTLNKMASMATRSRNFH